MHHRGFLAVACALALSACGASSSTVSCDISANKSCQEFSGSINIDNLKPLCASGGGSFSQAPCSHTGSLGACRQESNGLTTTVWQYPTAGLTAADVKASCGANSTYIAP